MPQRGAPPERSYAGITQQIPALAPSETAPSGRGGQRQFDLRPESRFDLRPAPENQTDEPGFLAGVREMFIPEDFELADIYRGPAYALRHPIDSIGLLYDAAKQAGLQQGEKAGTAWAEGKIPEALGHGLAATIPMIGPVAAQTGERIGQGELARGLGNLTGLLGPSAIAAGLRAVPRALPREVLPAEGMARIRTTPSERGAVAAKGLEAIAERGLGGARIFADFRESQQAGLARWADDIVEDISGFTGTAEEVGLRVDRALTQAKEGIRAQAREMYAAIDEAVTPETVRRPVYTEEPSSLVGPQGEALTTQRRTLEPQQVGGVRPKTLPIRQEAAKALRQLNEVRTIPSTELAQMRTQLESLVNLPPRTTFYDFQTGRSILLDVTRRFDDPVSGRRAGMSRQMAARMDEAMETALKEAGRDDLLTQLREANELTRHLHETFNESVIHKLLDSAPEKAHTFLTSNSTSLADLRRIKGTLPVETWDTLKAQVLRDLFDQAQKGEAVISQDVAIPGSLPGMNEAAAGIRTGRSNYQPGASFRHGAGGIQGRLEKLGSQRVQTIFDPPELRQLQQIATTAERVGVNTQSWIAQAVNAVIYWRAAQGVVTADLSALGQAGAMYGAQNVLARALIHQPGRMGQALERMITTMASKDTQAAAEASRVVAILMIQEEQRMAAEQREQQEMIPLPPLAPSP